jgi:multidrug efflux pump subunit AcrB
MENISSFFIKNYKLTIVLTIGMVIHGVMGLMRMTAESYPNVDFAMAIVTTDYDGASAEDIETKITKPIEDGIRGVSGIKDVRSISQAGLSSIFIRLDIDNIDTPSVMADLQRSVDRVTDLPGDLRNQPRFEEIKTEEMPVFEIAVIGSNENRRRDLVADLLKEELEDNSRVKSVRLTGYSERRFQVNLDLEKMKSYHIGINEVTNQIRARNLNIPGGSLKDDIIQKLVRVEGQIRSGEELGDVLLRSNFSGQQVFLKDIATVIDSEEEIPVRTRYNGEEATLIIVSKKAGADTIALVDEASETLKQYIALYGDEFEFVVYNDESVKVQDKLEVLTENAMTGFFLVILFLFIFLPGRVGLMASLSLPLAILATIGLMPSFGMTLNAITILALVIAIGMLVDNSVVISENYTRLRIEGDDPVTAAKTSVRQLWLPISATAFTTIAAFLPMLVTTGIMGQFIRFIPIIVTVSLLFSLAESFIFLPMRLALGGGKVKVKVDDRPYDWFARVEEKFETLMHKLVLRRYWVAGFFSLIIMFSFYMMIFANKFILFPAEQTELYLARYKSSTGTRLEVSHDITKRLSQRIFEEAGDKYVKHIIGRSGTSTAGFADPKAEDGNNVGILFIYATDYAKDNIIHTDFLTKLRKVGAGELGLQELSFEAIVNGPPVGNDIEATFRSSNDEAMESLLRQVVSELEVIPGIQDIRIDDVIGDDEVHLNIDYPKADRVGLNVNSIGDTIRTAVSGEVISTVTLSNKDVDIFVQLDESARRNISDLSQLPIMDNRGNLVPLATVAQFDHRQGAPHIKRYDFKRARTLTASVDETLITANEANIRLENIYASLASAYPEVSLRFGGVAESTQESMDSLFNALVLSLIGIFALLVFLFSSYLRPLIIMSTIPLGLLGFSIAFFLHGRPISFLALIGVIGLGGIIVNAGIVLISFIDQLRDEGKFSLDEILAKASRMRLRAVFVTSLTTISGLIPTAYGIGGKDAMLIPMTMAMAWGLTSGTILTLVWIPCAYAILEDFVAFIDRVKSFIFGRKVNSVLGEEGV